MLNMIMRLRTYDLKQFPADFVEISWNLGVSIKGTLVKSSILTVVYAFRGYTPCCRRVKMAPAVEMVRKSIQHA